ncbi:dynein cytoplasmic 1 light intermediate chain, partial [Tremellales sp. Uapishka_1]
MTHAAETSSSSSSSTSDLWADILRSADRQKQKGYGRKNLIVLSERHHGRNYLIDQLIGSKKRKASKRNAGLVMGYQVMEIKEEGEEDSIPPLSIYYPPSSNKGLVKLLPVVLPPKSLSDTTVMIVLDWTRISSMIKELINWLVWIDDWASESAQRGEGEDLRERIQSHIQHYTEPPPPNSPANASSIGYTAGPLLPLGQGTLSANKNGVPITIVCTKADLMDTTGDELGMKGGGWEERTDWVQQVLRTISLTYGASLFYTAPTQPQTYTLLRQYLLHRFYTLPPPLNPSSSEPAPSAPSSARFPFQYRANVLDRDAVIVPSGWDSWGKINVLRDGFDPARICKALETSLRGEEDGEDKDLEDIWVEMIPDMERGPKSTNPHTITTTSDPEQAFLSRQLDILQKDPNRDPRASFRAAAASASATSGVVGPVDSGGLSLPGVEKAMAEMEGGTAEDLKERFARIARRESSKGGAGGMPLPSPTVSTSASAPSPTTSTAAVPNEALHNFFQGLLATRTKSSTAVPTTNTMPPPPVPSSAKSVSSDRSTK